MIMDGYGDWYKSLFDKSYSQPWDLQQMRSYFKLTTEQKLCIIDNKLDEIRICHSYILKKHRKEALKDGY